MISCRTLGQRGMTLVELLVAMVIGLILLGGVYQIFVGSTTSSRENEQFARIQENARFAMEIFGRDLRMAGYSGCFGGTPVNNLEPTGTGYIAEFLDFTKAVQGNNWTGPGWTPAIDTTLIVNAVTGSDILTVRSLDNNDMVEITGSNANAANLAVVSRLNIDQGEVVIVSDCVGADIFQVTSASTSSTLAHGVSTNPGNISPSLSKGYDAGSEVFKFRNLIYYVRNNPAGIPSLYRLRWDGTSGASGVVVPEELVQGVERMQIRYGIDTNVDGDGRVNHADSYVPIVAAANWAQVVAVRVVLLLQSDINGKAPVDTLNYDLDGDGVVDADQPAAERRMRRVFKSTFALRNRTS